MRVEDLPPELLEIVDRAAGRKHSAGGAVAQCLAEVLSRLEQIRPQACPYDCDSCHGEDCSCERLGCAGYRD